MKLGKFSLFHQPGMSWNKANLWEGSLTTLPFGGSCEVIIIWVDECGLIWVFPKIGGFYPQNGWWKFHGKPYEQMDDLGGKNHYFWKHLPSLKLT